MMCQADDGNLGEDGVAPEGALQSGDGGEELDRGLPRQLTIHFCARDGMLSAFSDDVPEFYIAGNDPDAVLADIAPVLTKILADNYGKTVPEYCNRMVGLLSQLTEGQRAALFAYDGPEYLGGENRSPDEEPQGGDTVPAASTEASLTRPFKDTVIDRMMSDREFCEALLDEQKSALAEAVQAERARTEAIVTDVMDECSAKMHKYFAREQDTSAEVFRLRMEGAARVAQKLGMLVPADEDASAIRKEDATNG